MRSIIIACLVLFAAAPAASAQPANAVGKPLPDGSLRDGTVSVRVIAGDRAKPVTGVDVTLTLTPPSGTGAPTTQTARTDVDGRTSFTSVPPNVLVRLTTAGTDGKEVASSQFPMAMSGGVRVLLSTIDMGGGAAAQPAGRGPMSPRAMSGQPRPEAADDRATITVRVSYDDFADPQPLGGIPVVLVGYRHDLMVRGRVVTTDPAGRAVFGDLDPRGAVSYFTMALLPRNGAHDRLTSVPILLDGEAGVRVMLSGDKRTATTPPIDDLGRLDDQPATLIPPGEVRVALSGVPERDVPVELVDALTGTVVQSLPAGPALPAPDGGQPRSEGGVLFTGVATGGDRAYAVRTTMRGQPYVSAPFQLSPERGVAITVLVMPRVMFSFSLTSWIDDVYLGARGSFGIRNAAWAPYVAQKEGRPDELVLPLPRGFTGAIVRDDFAEQVGIDPARGFVIRRPIPPGGTQFVAGFSMEIHDGELTWDMPLPLGAYESGIEIKHETAGMRIVLPSSVRGITVQEADDERGKFSVLTPITILPGKSMVFHVRGLPAAPAWQRHTKAAVGVIVLIILGLTAGFALIRPRRVGPPARFDVLLDELAALEASNGDPARRAQLTAELEALYRAGGPPR